MSSNDKTRIVPPSPSGPAVGPGVQLNGMYEIDERIAFGGMGEVYRGHNIQTGDPVAIKIVLPEFARDESILALFRKEASILNHLSHDAIVRYHVFSIDPAIGRPYLAMEFVDGVSVADRMAERPFSPREARKLMQRIASGLALAHEAGVIHRDLSPDNIILPGGNVNKSKIIDFGIARSASVGGGTLLGGKFAGKYNFVSPEQLGLFGAEVTERSDIYSLGLVIAGALRGEAIDMSGSQVEVIEKRRTVPDLGLIDEALRPLIEAMLQPDPRNRPESADDIVEWLRATTERSIPPLGGSHPGPSSGGFGQGAFSPTGTPRSMPPAPPGSVPPYPGTTPPYPPIPAPGVSQTPVSIPPQQTIVATGSVPPAAAPSPLLVPVSQPPVYTPPNLLPPRPLPAAAQPPKSSRTPLYAALAVGVVLLAGVGAWFSGALTPKTGAEIPATGPTLTPPTASPGAATAPAATAETVAPTTPTAETQTAQNQAPAQAPAQPATQPAPALAADGAAWLASYEGGPCLTAAATGGSGTAIDITAFAATPAAFDKLAADYKAATGSEARLTRRQVTEAQCPAVDFLEAHREAANLSPTLSLNVDQLKFNERLEGTVSNASARIVGLLLVDADGAVYPLTALLKDGAFGFKLAEDPNAPAQERDNAAPNLVLAIASPQTLAAASKQLPDYAKNVFPRLRGEIDANPADVGVAAGYFTLGK